VEARTAKHDHYHDHPRCPRYSPSPPPSVVNVCREARYEARMIAEQAGHLIFGSVSDAADIHFNPAMDTLYVPNEKEYWIRDWSPEGILTQFKSNHQPDRLRFLAIGLDPLTRGTSPYSLQSDMMDFQKLEEIIFIVKETDEDICTRIRTFDFNLRSWARHPCQAQGKFRHYPYPGECKLAIKCAGRLQFVEKEERGIGPEVLVRGARGHI
jgi:hypothetical protein